MSEESEETRTLQQNKAIHLMNNWIADELNNAGLDIRKVIKPTMEIPWTPTAVKEYIVKPIMKSMYNKDSTTELNKSNKEIEHLYDVIMRNLGQMFGIEYRKFPNEQDRQKQYYDNYQ